MCITLSLSCDQSLFQGINQCLQLGRESIFHVCISIHSIQFKTRASFAKPQGSVMLHLVQSYELLTLSVDDRSVHQGIT